MRRDVYEPVADDGLASVPVKVGRRDSGCLARDLEVVSLFAGAGGLDLGFKQAGFKISLAIDSSEAAVKTHKRNFRKSKALAKDLLKLGPRGVLKQTTRAIPPGHRIGVIGGPPCQGFSRANTQAQTDDPRNKLPSLYLRIVKKLQTQYTVEFVVFENVLGIRDKRHAKVYESLVAGLGDLGFDVTEKELCALDFGVPQTRRRIVLSGLRKDQGYLEVRPHKCHVGLTSVREAIGGLKEPAYFEVGSNPRKFPVHQNHWTMQPKSARFAKPNGTTKDVRSFKKLRWNRPSPTIAFGHREIFVHPTGCRRLSIYEAMLLQGFPSSFVIKGNLSEQVEQISNAVPPPLARRVALAVKRALNGR